MKKVSGFLYSVTILLLLCSNLKAQIRVTNYSQGNTVATVNGASIIVWSLYVLDSFDTQYNGFHTAVFEVSLGSDMVKKILNDLQSATQQKPLQELALVKLNMQAKPVEQRTYGSVVVKEISLSDLSADGKEPAKARITIQAQTVMISDNSSLTIAVTSDKQKIPVNAFKVTIGSLPVQRISRVANLKFIPGSGQPLYFTVDIASTDARQWNDWFRTAARGGKKEYGNITLMDAAMSTPLLSIDLYDVEIVSISSVTSINSESTAKITVGLRGTVGPIR